MVKSLPSCFLTCYLNLKLTLAAAPQKAGPGYEAELCVQVINSGDKPRGAGREGQNCHSEEGITQGHIMGVATVRGDTALTLSKRLRGLWRVPEFSVQGIKGENMRLLDPMTRWSKVNSWTEVNLLRFLDGNMCELPVDSRGSSRVLASKGPQSRKHEVCVRQVGTVRSHWQGGGGRLSGANL